MATFRCNKDTKPRFVVQECRQDVMTSAQAVEVLQRNNVVRGDAHVLRTPRGRPYFSGENAHVDCSWSHSQSLLAIVWSTTQRVGIDIEPDTPRDNAKKISRRFFLTQEADAIDAGADFLRLWVMKEALLKAIGQGLAHGLQRVAFSWQGTAWVLESVDSSLCVHGDWCVELIEPAPGFVGALAWRPQYTDAHDDN